MRFNYSIFRLFPQTLGELLQTVVDRNNIIPEEIRVRLGQPVIIRSAGNEYICGSKNVISSDISHIIMNATNGAFHAVLNNIQNGYLSLPNGCRLGLCGEGTIQNNTIRSLRHISSLCIRVANQVYGCADTILPSVLTPNFQNTIIVAPPGVGKTTLLRECIRKLSDYGNYVGVVDERGELTGMYNGEPSFDLGKRTDVIYRIPKPMASTMLIRTMAPDILATDEITSVQDMPAIIEAFGCGIGLITTIHGQAISDLLKPAFYSIYELNIFDLAVIISMKNGCREYQTEKLHD